VKHEVTLHYLHTYYVWVGALSALFQTHSVPLNLNLLEGCSEVRHVLLLLLLLLLCLVVLQADLMEWQLLMGWSHSTHTRFPRRLKDAVKLLLLAAASTSSTSAAESSGSSGSNGSSSTQLLAQLPSVVLEQVIADAALPQGSWADAKTPMQQQLEAALRARPAPAHAPGFVHPLQLGLVLQQMMMPGGGGGVGP
jgi:hypothetical protein